MIYQNTDQERRRACLKDCTSYIFIFMDFQEKRRGSVQEFFGSIFAALKTEAGGKIGPLPKPGYDGFK